VVKASRRGTRLLTGLAWLPTLALLAAILAGAPLPWLGITIGELPVTETRVPHAAPTPQPTVTPSATDAPATLVASTSSPELVLASALPPVPVRMLTHAGDRTWVRCTYYGEYYKDRMKMASGELYFRDAWSIALGPKLLEQAREMTGMRWPHVWLVIGNKAFCIEVLDTGGEALEVDLPDETWVEVTGLDPSAGVAQGWLFVEAAP
jgi:hypothetical protein